ncbi:sensor histidine kinase [Alkalicoccus urumqiensis]|uniref:Signal transduction histidine-protein kinase ArlS n=1 Tax=Alkalicoccus urumqiensis TaxID=1548213 RepID=A0A2P6MI69_ALKUR|nr:ATP-binding protein [Alkalicoccus urumqiensis]PRO65958.1 two-component sensor histidine kinase [Alkalicoccus urumqiensis]
MKLSRRITVVSTGVLLIFLLLINSGIYVLFQQSLMNGELDRALNQARTAAEVVNDQRGDPASYVESYVSGDGMIRVLDQTNEALVTVTSRNTELQRLPVTTENRTAEQTDYFRYQDQLYAAGRVPVLWENGRVASLEVIEPLSQYEETLQILRVILIAASLALLLPSYIAARSLSRFVLRPIQSLVETMKQIQQNGTFQRIDVPDGRKDELGEMGETFNSMMALLEENYHKQQQFVSDASHELKTPLTVIGSYAQLLKRRGRDRPDVVEEASEAIESEAERMKEMTNQMLALASGENLRVEKGLVDAGAVFSSTGKRLSEAYQRTIHVPEESAVVYGSEMHLKQLAYLLIENALKYSEDDVHVTLETNEQEVVFHVRDHGIGIREEDQEAVFDRFYRVDKARTRAKGGTGLGLAIAKQITDLHHGSLTLQSTYGEGSTFSVSLPKKGEADETSVDH